MTAKYIVDIFQGFNLNPFTADGKPSPTYWRGAIRCGTKTVARTSQYKNRKSAERAAAKLLTQFDTTI